MKIWVSLLGLLATAVSFADGGHLVVKQDEVVGIALSEVYPFPSPSEWKLTACTGGIASRVSVDPRTGAFTVDARGYVFEGYIGAAHSCSGTVVSDGVLKNWYQFTFEIAAPETNQIQWKMRSVAEQKGLILLSSPQKIEWGAHSFLGWNLSDQIIRPHGQAIRLKLINGPDWIEVSPVNPRYLKIKSGATPPPEMHKIEVEATDLVKRIKAELWYHVG